MNLRQPVFRSGSPAPPPGEGGRVDVLAYVLLAATVAILGFNWPLLAIGLESLSPLWFGALRLMSAAVVMFPAVAVARKLRPPAHTDLSVVASIGLGRLVGVLLLVLLALKIVPPGRASVLVWTASLWTVPIAARYLGETMTLRRWHGIIVAVSGIFVLVEPWRSDLNGRVIGGYLLLLAAAVLNASTAVHARAHRWSDTPLALLPWQLLVATLPVVLMALAFDGVPRIDWSLELAGIVAYQGVLATSFAMWAQLTVLQRLPAVPTNLALMLVPVVGVISSVVVVHEKMTVAALLGAAMIGVGVLAGMDLRRKAPVAPHVD